MNTKRFKKLVALVIALTLALTMTACSKPTAAQTEAAPTAEPAAAQPAAATSTDTAAQPQAAASTETTAPAPAEQQPAVQENATNSAAPAETTAASGEANKPAAEPNAAATTAPAENNTAQPEANYALKEAIASQPAYLTSVGQSADVQMVKALMEKAKIKYTFNATAKPEDLNGVKTLVLAVGGSSKGLGAAGIKAEDELERTAALIKKAKADGMIIICLHIGGEARRGELSDKFVHAAIPSADYVIVVADGNKDGLFTTLTSKGIPLDTVEKISKAIDPLKHAFK